MFNYVYDGMPQIFAKMLYNLNITTTKSKQTELRFSIYSYSLKFLCLTSLISFKIAFSLIVIAVDQTSNFRHSVGPDYNYYNI